MELWFDTGLLMEDGVTSISVLAQNDLQAAEYGRKGWRPLDLPGQRKKARGKKDGWREQGGREGDREGI